MFEVETTALAHVACATRDSGNLVTDIACAYPSVNHSWSSTFLKRQNLPVCIRQFSRLIYNNSMTEVEFAGKARGQFLMARGVGQAWLSTLSSDGTMIRSF